MRSRKSARKALVSCAFSGFMASLEIHHFDPGPSLSELGRNDRFRCITAHSLAIFLPRVEDFVQQAQLVCCLARFQDVDQAAHGDPQQAHGRALRNGSVE